MASPPTTTPESTCVAAVASASCTEIVACKAVASVVGTVMVTSSTTLPALAVTVTVEASTPAAAATDCLHADRTTGV